MQSKKIFYMAIVTILTILSATSVAFAAGEEQAGPAAFNGMVFGLLLVFVVGLAAIVLYGSTKTGAGTKEIKGPKNSPRGRKR